MEKSELKLLKDNDHDKNFKIGDKKNENVIQIEPLVELNNQLICISYEEIEVKKCGFDYISKIEIYKDYDVVYCQECVQDFYIEFPRFSSDGTYEIRTVFKNQSSGDTLNVINSFEFFNYKKENVSNRFNLELSRDNRNLKVTFNKKIGNLDLSEINLSNIVLIDSNNNYIKNIPCKLHVKLNTIDFLILDVFDDNSTRLIPNEVYSLCISFRNRELFSSFSFEYDNIEMSAHRVVEKVDHEVLFNVAKDVLCLKLLIKLNPLINIYDYEYFISNIRNKFLYFKSSEGDKEDTIVFECIVKREKGYFEFNICKGSSISVIKFDYDLIGEEVLINERVHFELPQIYKNLTKYTIEVFPKNQDQKLITPYFGISDRFGQLGNALTNKNFVEGGKIVSRENGNSIVFTDMTILNKFSEIYTVEIDYDVKECFIFSSSIGVKFNKIEYETYIKDNNVYLKFDNFKKDLCIKYTFDLKKEFEYINGEECFNFQIQDLKKSKSIYIKVYDENNKSFLESIMLDDIEIGAIIKNFRCEKCSIDSDNYLTLVDKNIFDEFSENFEIFVIKEDGQVVLKKYIKEFNPKFKICFDEKEMLKEGLYYLKFSKGENYKINSFFITSLNKNKNLFINNFEEGCMSVHFLNFNSYYNELINISLYFIMDNKKYLVVNDDYKIVNDVLDVKFPVNAVINNMDYLVKFNIYKKFKKSIYFTYFKEKDINGDEDFKVNLFNDKILEENIYDIHENLDDLSIILKNAYRIFLNKDIKTSNNEFIYFKDYIKENKVSLKYFIDIFCFEYFVINEFTSDCYQKCINKVFEFLKIRESMRIKVLRDGIKFSNDDFISEIFNLIKDTQEFLIFEDIFKNLY